MKFGTQLKSKSVPEWRSYNIDYNDLKHRIRITTEVNSAKNQAFVRDLHDSFIEQIDMVNLFLQSKVGEVKRRIVYVENTVEQLESSHVNDTTENDDDHTSPRAKIYHELTVNLDKLSSDLQKLSRFIVLQKTGLRKLLKKYTKYSGDGGNLNLEINKYMIKNQNSFIYIDLTGFYLELALIYDLIRGKQSPSASAVSASASVPSSATTVKNRRTSYADPVEDLNINEVFDFENIKNGTQKEHFLVHYDNLTELKLFLLSNFYCVDESVRHERRNLQLQRQKSSLSFRQIIERRSSIEDLNKKQEHQKKQNDEALEGFVDNSNADIFKTNSIYLNNNDQLSNNGDMTVIYLDDPKHLQSIRTDADPGLLITDLSNQRRTLLISAIGGLRKASNALFNDPSFVDDLLKTCVEEEGEAGYKSFVARHYEFIQSLDSLERISIEWIFSRHIKALVKSSCTKTRFTGTRSPSNSKSKSWITLSSNIKYSSTDLTTNSWTTGNTESSSFFPYAVLEIRYATSATSLQIPQELNKLMESHLVYKVENTLNPLTFHLFTSKSLSFEPSWAQYFGDSPVDIRKNPPRAPRRVKTNTGLKAGQRTDSTVSLSAHSDTSGDKLQGPGSVSAESSQFRYWNEFDNGSEGEDTNGFFVDVDSGDDQFFTSGSMEYIYKIANSVVNFLQEKVPFMFPDEELHGPTHDALLLGPDHRHYNQYGSMMAPSISTRQESDIESLRSVDSKRSHDIFRVWLALSSSMVSLVLVALSLGVTASLLGFGDVSVNPFVILILVMTFFASMTLSVVSIGLMMAVEEEFRKVWQVAFVWVSFFAVTLLTVLGTVGLFGL